jgi:hypothetical protein
MGESSLSRMGRGVPADGSLAMKFPFWRAMLLSAISRSPGRG